MSSGGQSTDRTPALLASITPLGESDSLTNFITPEGTLQLRARSLRKPQSKLAPSLQPAAELLISGARGRGARGVLTGVTITRQHQQWRDDLNLAALYWFMVECVFIGAGEQQLNRDMFQLSVNLIRSTSGEDKMHNAAAVFCLKLLKLHGLLPDLAQCMMDDHTITPDEPVFLPPAGEGVVGRDAYNRHYARSGGGLLRLDAMRRVAWCNLAGGALLDYPTITVDNTDAAVLIQLTSRQLGDIAGCGVRSAEFLLQQWSLPSMAEVLRGQIG